MWATVFDPAHLFFQRIDFQTQAEAAVQFPVIFIRFEPNLEISYTVLRYLFLANFINFVLPTLEFLDAD